MEAGLDSLGAVELRNAISARFGGKLPATVTFDYPTPAAMAAHIAEQSAASLPQAASSEPARVSGASVLTASTAGTCLHVPVKCLLLDCFSMTLCMFMTTSCQRATCYMLADNIALATLVQARSGADVEAGLQQVLQNILGTALAPDQPFMEAGVDSLGAAELRNAVGAKFGITDLPATLVFDYPTVAALAVYLAALQLPSSIGAAAVPAAAVPAVVHAKEAAWLARASEVVGLSCRYPGSDAGKFEDMSHLGSLGLLAFLPVKTLHSHACWQHSAEGKARCSPPGLMHPHQAIRASGPARSPVRTCP